MSKLLSKFWGFVTLTLFSLWNVTNGLRRPFPLTCAEGHVAASAVAAALAASWWQRRAWTVPMHQGRARMERTPIPLSGVASSEIFFGGGKMFDFRRVPLFCSETQLSKHKMTIFTKNLGRGAAWPLWPPWLRLWCRFTSLRFEPSLPVSVARALFSRPLSRLNVEVNVLKLWKTADMGKCFFLTILHHKAGFTFFWSFPKVLPETLCHFHLLFP